MRLLSVEGNPDLAMVYVAEDGEGRRLEFVDSIQPPRTRDEKWVVIVSTLFGCPVGCQMCDAGGYYHGRVSTEHLLAQIDYLVRKRYPDGNVPCPKTWLAQRMGSALLILCDLWTDDAYIPARCSE